MFSWSSTPPSDNLPLEFKKHLFFQRLFSLLDMIKKTQTVENDLGLFVLSL